MFLRMSRVVPSVCRRIVALLVVALLGARCAGRVLAQARQGAGDQQYQDPFGGDGSGAGGSGSGAPKLGGSGRSRRITPGPQSRSSGPRCPPRPPARRGPQAPAAGRRDPGRARRSSPAAHRLRRPSWSRWPALVLLLGGLALWRRPHADR